MKDTLIRLLLQIPILLYSVVLHEVAHGYVALQNGDATALENGRLTLNPLPHIDWTWSVLVPGIMILTRSPVILGTAKPVPVDPSRFFTNPRLAGLEVGLAGPATNLLLALTATLLLRLFTQSLRRSRVGLYIRFGLVFAVILNVSLMIFNFVPIPPLDGFSLIRYLWPEVGNFLLVRSFYLSLAFLFAILLVPAARQLIFRPIQKVAAALLRWAEPAPPAPPSAASGEPIS